MYILYMPSTNKYSQTVLNDQLILAKLKYRMTHLEIWFVRFHQFNRFPLPDEYRQRVSQPCHHQPLASQQGNYGCCASLEFLQGKGEC